MCTLIFYLSSPFLLSLVVLVLSVIVALPSFTASSTCSSPLSCSFPLATHLLPPSGGSMVCKNHARYPGGQHIFNVSQIENLPWEIVYAHVHKLSVEECPHEYIPRKTCPRQISQNGKRSPWKSCHFYNFSIEKLPNLNFAWKSYNLDNLRGKAVITTTFPRSKCHFDDASAEKL